MRGQGPSFFSSAGSTYPFRGLGGVYTLAWASRECFLP